MDHAVAAAPLAVADLAKSYAVEHAVTAAPLSVAHLANSPKKLANWTSRSGALVDTTANTNFSPFSYAPPFLVVCFIDTPPFITLLP